jgi:hypothetical protein
MEYYKTGTAFYDLIGLNPSTLFTRKHPRWAFYRLLVINCCAQAQTVAI